MCSLIIIDRANKIARGFGIDTGEDDKAMDIVRNEKPGIELINRDRDLFPVPVGTKLNINVPASGKPSQKVDIYIIQLSSFFHFIISNLVRKEGII